MKIAFTYNLKLTDTEEEAEFDSEETVEAIAAALTAAGHDVEKIEASGPASSLVARLEASDPDLIFNTAEGRRGKAREAFYPALFDELGFPYTGSDAYVLTLTLDKWLTKLVLAAHGVDSPRGRLVSDHDLANVAASGVGLAYPVIVKPNYEGSSKGIGVEAVAQDHKSLVDLLRKELVTYPTGVIVEEFIPGNDVTVAYLRGTAEGPGDAGILAPVEFIFDPSVRNQDNIYDYRLKHIDPAFVQARCPADIPRDVAGRLRSLSQTVVKALGIRELARIDYRLGKDGRIYLLEVNGLPSLERGSALMAAAAHAGVHFENAITSIANAAALRWKLATPEELGASREKKKTQPVRVGFAYNMKRIESKDGDDAEAEYDPPETIAAITDAIASFGHAVVHLEATADLPRVLAESDVDVVFNIAEGLRGRNREAQVPALCELLGIPYTGSDSATLSICLDKSLAKKVLMQHKILTPEFQLFVTGRERLSPTLKFPVIVKPNAEGSSKGIPRTCVFDAEEPLREAVKNLIEKYRQPALVEEYVTGREFTIGVLGGARRQRILPPMEIVFLDKSNERPVYDFQVKQEWEKHVSYKCPPELTPSELRALERVARRTFVALDCRDVARIDVRMTSAGEVYVIELNPLPGLTPDYSDLALICQAEGMGYRALIGEILAGGLRRMKSKRRTERAERAAERTAEKAIAAEAAAAGNGNGNGSSKSGSKNGNGKSNGSGKNGKNGKSPTFRDPPPSVSS